MHILDLGNGSINHILRNNEIEGAIVAHLESILGYSLQRIAGLLRNNEKSISLEEFGEVVATDLAGFLIEL